MEKLFQQLNDVRIFKKKKKDINKTEILHFKHIAMQQNYGRKGGFWGGGTCAILKYQYTRHSTHS